jgi:hypothetical protein
MFLCIDDSTQGKERSVVDFHENLRSVPVLVNKTLDRKEKRGVIHFSLGPDHNGQNLAWKKEKILEQGWSNSRSRSTGRSRPIFFQNCIFQL